MSKRGLFTVLLCALSVLCWASGDRLRWYMSFDMARRIAKEQNKPLLVDIYVDGSSNSHRLLNETFANERVMKATSKFVLVRLNSAREGAPVGRSYRLLAGGMLFIGPDGRLLHRLVGFYGPRSIEIEMEKAYGSFRDRAIMLSRLKKNPKDGIAAARLAAIYAYELDSDKAVPMLALAEKYRSSTDRYLLPEAYNAVGDFFQIRRQFNKAIPYFQKAAQLGKRPYDIAYAHISIGACYISTRERDKAIAALEQVSTVPGVAAEDKGIAKELLQGLFRSSNGARIR